MSSRALLVIAFVVVIAIVAAYFLMNRSGDTYQRTSYPTQMPTQTAPVPVGDTAPPPPDPASEPVDPNDTGGAAHGGAPPPPQ